MKEEMITVSYKQLEEFRDNMIRNVTCKDDIFQVEKFNKILNPIPTMTEEDWQRVIDEGFYVFNSTTENTLHFREDVHNPRDTHIRPVREVGIRQPHFKRHPHPEGDTKVWTLGKSGQGFFFTNCDLITWDNVVEYIVLEETSDD